MSGFAHLHVHSRYSAGDGRATHQAYLAAAAANGQRALALTDHGTMAGAVQFYLAARAAGIKPIIGTELYVDRFGPEDERRPKYPNHLTVLAMNEQGYRDLVRANTLASASFYYRPRVAFRTLVEEGLMRHWVVMSGCLRGDVSRLLADDDVDTAVELVEVLRRCAGLFCLEVMHHPLPEHGVTARDTELNGLQETVLHRAAEVVRRTGVPTVVTGDCHYATAGDEAVHQGWLRGLGGTDVHGLFGCTGYWLAPDTVMAETAERAGFPAAFANAAAVADTCTGYDIVEATAPRWHVPVTGDDPAAVIDAAARERLRDLSPEYWERYEREMGVLTGAEHIMRSYMVARDVVGWCRTRGIPVFCRGSMAGSLVSWLLGITRDDPVRWKLAFERAVNPARPTIPDFDIDVSSDRRREVLEHIAEVFPESRPICSFTGYSPRGALRAVMSAEGTSPQDITKATSSVPDSWDEDWAALTVTRPREALIASFKDLVSSVSVHPAGVVVSDGNRPLGNEVPLVRVPSSETTATQFDMYTLKLLRFFKLDVLGLKALDQLAAMARFTGDDPPDDYDDPDVIDLFRRGMTAEIFQFDGAAARAVAAEVGVNNFEDLVAVNALARPGGFLGVAGYANGGSTFLVDTYPKLEPIIGYSRGVFIYQEQAMAACGVLAGFDDARQDDLKEAMKGRRDKFEELGLLFLTGCAERGYSGAPAWDAIRRFADYGFNRAHAVSYAGLAYRMAWYKWYHPAAYYASVFDDSANRPGLVAESIDAGVTWELPDINRSAYDTVLDGDTIRLGLGMIKGIGKSAVKAIIKVRPVDGPDDLVARADKRACSVKVRRLLEEAGAFGNPSGPRVRELFGFDPRVITPVTVRRACVYGDSWLGGFIVEVREQECGPNLRNWAGRTRASVIVAGPGYKETVWLNPDQYAGLERDMAAAHAVLFEGQWAQGRRAFRPKQAWVVI